MTTTKEPKTKKRSKPPAKKATKKPPKAKRLVPQIMLDVNGASVVIDARKYDSMLQARITERSASDASLSKAVQYQKFSLTQCGELCDVDAPQLNYYCKENIVTPVVGDNGKKKFFDYVGLLAFFVITDIKRKTGLNIDVFKALQGKLVA